VEMAADDLSSRWGCPRPTERLPSWGVGGPNGLPTRELPMTSEWRADGDSADAELDIELFSGGTGACKLDLRYTGPGGGESRPPTPLLSSTCERNAPPKPSPCFGK